MEETEKGLLIAAAVFGFMMAVLLARGIFGQEEEIQKSTYDRNLWKRNVVIVALDAPEDVWEMKGNDYG